jgi:hypothetical protein
MSRVEYCWLVRFDVTICGVLPPPREQAPLPVPTEFGAQLAGFPVAVERLLADHVPDTRGRCHACDLPQSAAPRWPCTLAAYAQEAHRLQRSRRLP